MNLMFLDLGRLTGYCYGPAGSVPTSGSIVLRKTSEDSGLGLGKLGRWLRDHVRANGAPDLIGIEHWLPPDAAVNNKALVDGLRLNGAVHSIAGVYGISITEPYPATIRSQVCGAAYGQRQVSGKRDTKAMVIRTVTILGMVPPGTTDEDRCDAVAGWIFLQANFARMAPKNLILTG